MAMTTRLWTINALAAELGISHRVLGRRLSDLAPDEVEQQSGRQVKSWRLARVVRHLKAADKASTAEGQDVHAERARLVRARACKAEIEIAALERSLLPFDEVVQAWEQLVAAFRARCLAMPTKLAPRLAVMNERREVQAVLTAAVREALLELSRFDLQGPAPREPAGGNGKTRPRPARGH